jgi:hypothetical protein
MPRSNRGRHPDLDESGNLLPDAHLPRADRDFARMAADPARWQAFYDQLTAAQAQEHPDVQAYVQGRTFVPDGTLLDGFREYQRQLRWARENVGDLTSEMVGRMSLEEYNELFDEKGRPRDGRTLRPTARDVPLDSTHMDPSSRQEFRR